ncbi:MAG: PAS domain S-box protein [Planctomycetes bacterium]|nr:PAS domain S-box protein [Planctomycetota bacterium]
MATILIVDDRPANREFLVTLLGYGGHRLLEAADGQQALAITRAERPDLVIADILMPTMDGYEFVHRLRADSAIADTRVIFYTAHYHEAEACKLAAACGVTAVLTKPCEPEIVLRTVEAALGVAQTPTPAPPAEEFDREHLQLLTDKLSDKADELRRTNERLTVIVELGTQLGSERDPCRLLQVFCNAAREIVGARYALVGISNRTDGSYRHFFTSGMDLGTTSRATRSGPFTGVLASVLAAGNCFRTVNHGDLGTVGAPNSFPPASALLAAPVLSPTRVHGWVCLLDKLGSDTFTDEDEQLTRMLAAQVGRIYENGSLYADLLRQTAALTQEIADRKRAEAERDRMFQESLSLLGLLGFDGRFIQINPAWERSLGYSSEELLAEPFMNFVHPDDIAVSLAEVQRLADGGITTSLENRLRCKDGSYRFFLWTGFPLLDQRCFSVTGHDVTERRRLAAERDALLARLQLQIERLPMAYVLFDAHLRISDWNPAAERIFGYTKAEILGAGPPYEQFVPHSVWVTGEQLLSRIRSGDFEAHSINENLTKDGRTITCEWFNTPLFTDGQFGGLLCLAKDVTRRIHLEQQVRQTQQRLEHVVGSSPAVLFTLSIENNAIRGISWISDNLHELLGYSSLAASDPNWWAGNIHPDDRDRIITQTTADLFATNRTSHEYRFRHQDGTYLWTRGEIRLIRDPVGKALEAVGSWTDITERKLLEDQFRQAQKMEAVGRLAGGVAHDFNNLLTIINGYGEMVVAGLAVGDPNRESVLEIVAAGERAAGLTRQLLAFSRKAIVEPKVLDLKALVTEIDRMLRRIVGEDIELSIAADRDAGSVRADPGQLEQVILNLVVNARDAIARAGRLTIEVRNAELDETYTRHHSEVKPGLYVLLAVTDTGCGMDNATISRIFEPFFTTKGEHGTGLGLATVHGIVKQSGGHVEVYSEVGRGTTFKVYLPRIDKSPVASGPRSNYFTMPKGNETLLLVEDEDRVRALAQRVLLSCGYSVLAACDGAEAVRLARQQRGRIDLLVTDVVMPRMGGREVAEQVEKFHPGMKVLFLSGYTDDAVVRHGILEAEVAFLQKPFTPASLAAKIRDVLDGDGHSQKPS